ncbi:MAG: hypothetical protein HY291_08795 [Planctomycetes bacterium]|nr:hypothetical protein [Planctomycetota bacterium]
MKAADAEAGRPGARFYAAAALLLLAALALRALAARRDFWCDELWSLAAALHAKSCGELFANHSDNNHLLNSLWMYALGDHTEWFAYRVPAILGGALSVAMAGLLGLRRSRAEAVFSMLLMGGAYFTIHYASEARGYGLLMGFCLLAYWALEKYLATGRWAHAAVFVAACVLGVLAHLTFLYAYLGLLAWSAYRVLLKKECPAVTPGRLALAQGVPLVFFAIFYVTWARHLEIAGGDPAGGFEVIEQAFSMALGGPAQGTWLHAAALAAFGLLVAGFAYTLPGDRAGGVLFATVIFLAPGLFYVLKPPPYLTPRYFLVGMLFALLLWARLLAGAWSLGGIPRAFALLLAVCFLGLNGTRAARTIAQGRGGYEGALAAMYARSAGPEITVGSDFDARNANLVAFYARRLPDAKRFRYVTEDILREQGADWFLIHQLDDPDVPPEEIHDLRGNAYRYLGKFGYADLSGWPWFVYKRAEGAAAAGP